MTNLNICRTLVSLLAIVIFVQALPKDKILEKPVGPKDVNLNDANLDHANDFTDGADPLERKKRHMSPEEGKRWPKAIIPALRASNLVDPEWLDAIDATQATYSRFTCLRFPEYRTDLGPNKDQTTNQVLGLDHKGFVKYVAGTGCYAVFGNVRNENGQDNSCCAGHTCLHELGHTLGVYHEQQNPNHTEQSRINMGNIRPDMQITYKEEPGFNTGYDIQSIMHYTRWTWSGNNRRTMNKLNSQFNDIGGGDYYYLMQEVSLAHHCASLKCSDYTGPACVNDGYLTQVDGKCQCRCPEGLDPVDGCKSVLGHAEGGRFDDQRSWPAGKWALPQLNSGCSSGYPNFKKASVSYQSSIGPCPDLSAHCLGWKGQGKCESDGYVQDNCPQTCGFCSEEKIKSQNYDLAGQVSLDLQTDHFCVSDGSAGDPSDVSWPAGNYCIYRVGGSCPEGFKEGSIYFASTSGKNSQDGDIPDGEYTATGSTIQYCCRGDGFGDPLNLPAAQSFSLLGYRGGCQRVTGMIVQQGYKIVYIPDDADIKGSTPASSYKPSRRHFKLTSCYYTPANMDCGGTIELTPEDDHRKITQPSKKGSKCNWLFKGPPNTRIEIDFPKFNVALADASEECLDSVSLRFIRLGQSPYKYCGTKFNRGVTSVYNTLMVTYEGGVDSTFEGNVTLIHDGNCKRDSTWKQSDKGQSYRGKRDFTSQQRKCLSWSSLEGKCDYTPSKYPSEGLEGNYCRNPGGEGTTTWCYFATKECKRDYCDPCDYEKPWDAIKKGGTCDPNKCGLNAVNDRKWCAKTCEESLKTSWPGL